jgi:hypothetical protein
VGGSQRPENGMEAGWPWSWSAAGGRTGSSCLLFESNSGCVDITSYFTD